MGPHANRDKGGGLTAERLSTPRGRVRSTTTYQRIYAVVRRIPRGQVATYGQVASLAGLAGHARQVGYALHALTDGSVVPWHRVINARGEVSTRSVPGAELQQRFMLEAEGVRFNARGRVSLARFRWQPRHGQRSSALQRTL